jgi:excisionase family DNA binding protein
MKSAYNLDELAVEVGTSRRTLEREIKANRLVAIYVGTKPLVRHEEMLRWLDDLPTEKS